MSTKRAKDMTEAELAAHYYERRNDPGQWGPVEPVERVDPAQLSVTLSVRFTPDEIAAIRSAAEVAGVKVTAFIREAALAALIDAPLQTRELSAHLDAARELLSALSNEMGASAELVHAKLTSTTKTAATKKPTRRREPAQRA